MKKIVVSKHRQSREKIVNPNSSNTLSDRQDKSGCVKYGQNRVIEDLGNGYSRIVSKKSKNP